MRATALIFTLAACDSVLGLTPIAAPKVYRKPITITNNTGVTLQGFTVLLLDGTDSDLVAHAGDETTIGFTDDQGNVLPSDIVSYHSGGGSIDAWFRPPSVPPGQSTAWLVYGALAMPAPPSPWTSPYAAVWHMSRTDEKELDLGPNGHDLTTSNATIPATVPGIVGNARTFDGFIKNQLCDGHVNTSLDFGTSRSFTYSAWFNLPAFLGAAQIVQYKGGSSAGAPGFDMEIAQLSTLQLSDSGTGHFTEPLGTPATNAWAQVTGVVDRAAGTVQGYVNGAPNATTVPIAPGFDLGGSTQFCVGGDMVGNNLVLGAIDEVRVYDVALSQDWIHLEYLMITDHNRVVALGDEQPVP